MSADNYIAIFKDDDGRFRGYMGFASDERTAEQLRMGHALFDVGTCEEAILAAQEEYTEYGFHFVNIAAK